MFRDKYLRVLELDYNATEDDIKKRYREIALNNHPDKLINFSDDEREEREKVFKESTEAYEYLMDKDRIKTDEMFSSFGIDENLMSSFGVDETFMNEFQNMSINMGKMFETYNNMTTKFNTSVDISFYDLLTKRTLKKDVSIYGINIKIDVDCSKFPRQVVLKKMNGFKTEISIQMNLEEHEKFNHKIRKNGMIDLTYTIGLTHYQFYKGIESQVENIDGSMVYFKTNPGSDRKIKIKKAGLNGGDMLIRVEIINPKSSLLKEITEDEHKTLLDILAKLRYS